MNTPLFQRIDGVRKIIQCIDCGRRIEILNMNRKKCAECQKKA